jgi:hypothetical protein
MAAVITAEARIDKVHLDGLVSELIFNAGLSTGSSLN